MKNIYTILIIFCFATGAVAQHNSVYSQYFFNGLLVNPAYAGSQNALSTTAIYRNQWMGLNGAPQTLNFTAHMPLRSEKVNLGLMLMNDRFGINNNSSANVIYAYRIFFKKSALAFGLQAGINMQKINWGQIESNETSDPLLMGNIERKILPQAGFGIYYHTQNYFAGISTQSLISAHLIKYSPVMLFGGVVFKASESFRIKPALLIKYLAHSPMEIDASVTCYWRELIGLGLGYRANDAGVVFIDFRVNEQFRMGYAYDYTLSALKNYSSGSHEIMLRYLFLYKVDGKSPRYF